MKATILVIEDDPAMCESLDHTLQSEGYEVAIASSGPEALHALRETGFDLVLLDLDMSIANQWDTLGKIVTNSLALPLIVMTERPDWPRLSTQDGVAAILAKPLDMVVLLEVIERVLAQSAAPRRRRNEAGPSPAFKPRMRGQNPPHL